MDRRTAQSATNRSSLGAMEPTQILRLRPRTDPPLTVVRVQFGPGPFQVWVAHPNSTGIIGRAPDAELVVQDPSVSRYHARIEVDDNGELTLIDERSTNGSFVNHRKVEGSARIRPGDRVVVGAVAVLVETLSATELEQLRRTACRLDDAHRDPLTGLATRRWIESELGGFIARFERVGEKLSCMFIDLDRFKEINDCYGHGVGDQVLKGVAEVVLKAIRDQDVAVRFGGDEMVVFLARCSREQAIRVGDRVLRLARELNIPGMPAGSVRLTAGIAEHEGDSPSQWLERADAALYRAKRAGRDRIGC